MPLPVAVSAPLTVSVPRLLRPVLSPVLVSVPSTVMVPLRELLLSFLLATPMLPPSAVSVPSTVSVPRLFTQ